MTLQAGVCEVLDVEEGIEARAEATLDLLHRWGYAPRLDALAAGLLEGPVPESELSEVVRSSDRFTARDEMVCLRGREDLISRSRHRIESNHLLSAGAKRIAQAFTNDLVRVCPFVESVALSGSVASGGYDLCDDIDFDLIVAPGTKYTCYLIGTLLGFRYSWRHGGSAAPGAYRTPLFRKVTCINVVWPYDQCRPFVRQDANMAFELLRCVPLHGGHRFREVLDTNPWVFRFFPQARDKAWGIESEVKGSRLGRILQAFARSPDLLRAIERSSRWVSHLLYRYVERSRRGNLPAAKRMEFLRRVKYPYEVFQD